LPCEISPRLNQWIAAVKRNSCANSSGVVASGITSAGNSIVIVDTVAPPLVMVLNDW
jgi:hypothetical protein